MSSAIDFQGLFEATPVALMVLDHELRYVAANAEYLRVTASRRDDLLGRRIFELFPNDPDDPNNVPARMLRASFERVLATGQPDHLALIPYKVPMHVGGEVRVVDRVWSATHCPVLDGAGRVAFILQYTVDVSALRSEGEAAAARAGEGARMQAGLLSRAEAVQAENRRLADEREHLRVLFDQAPGFMAFLDGPRHVFSLANAAYRRLVGKREVVGKPVAEALPEVVGQGFIELLDRVYASGEPFVGDGLRVLLQRRPGGDPEEAFVDFIYQPVRGTDGEVRGIFVQGHDVTARKLAERESESARRAAEAFSAELIEQSRAVKDALDRANARIRELEAQLATAR